MQGPTIAVLVIVLVAGCALEREGLGLRDGGPRPGRTDGAVDRDGGGDAGIDAGDAGGGGADAEVDAGPIDAGPPRPTAITDLAMSGTHDSHPAVAWTGTEFVVGYVVGAPPEQHVDIVRVAPGAEPTSMPRRLTSTATTRKGVSIAAGPETAVGWIENRSGAWWGRAYVLPSDPGWEINGVKPSNDHDDFLLVWHGGALMAAMRMDGPGSDDVVWWVSFASTGGEYVGRAAAFGELAVTGGTRAPLVVGGDVGVILHRQPAGWWDLGPTASVGNPQEGAIAALSIDAALVVWTDTPSGLPRSLHAQRIVWTGSGWEEDVRMAIGWNGPDPAVALATADVVALAWAWEESGRRPAAYGFVSAGGSPLLGPCALPESLGVANDPDIACGGGYCAIVWLEGSSYDALDFRTRLVQVPADPAAGCAPP